MYIFLDSNIFHNNWFLKQANFRYLFNFISNTKCTLLVSELVCEEVGNNRQKEIDVIQHTINQQLKDAKKLLRKPVDYKAPDLGEPYSLKELLNEQPGDKEYFHYEQIKQSVVVKRAMKKILPFRGDEKGYRDTLIWLSLLDYLKKQKHQGEVVFISNNDSDFYKKPSLEFFDSLKEDIRAYGLTCKFDIFISLHNFVTAKINKQEHAFSYQEIYDRYLSSSRFERELAAEISVLLIGMGDSDFLSLIRSSNLKLFGIDLLLGHDFECWEGVEDAEVVESEQLTDTEVYFGYTFDLRRCSFTLTIPVSDYFPNAAEIDRFYANVEVGIETVELTFHVRAHFDVSFIYRADSDDFKGLNIHWADFERL